MHAPPHSPTDGWRGDVEHVADASTGTPRLLRVLVSDRAPGHRVAYVDQLLGEDSDGQAPDDIEFEFRGSVLDARDVDVVHLTQARAVLGDARTPEREQARRARRFAKALKRRRIALVRTAGEENAAAGSVSRAEEILHRATTRYIAMTPAASNVNGLPLTVIQHSHMRERFLGYPRANVRPGRLLFISAGTFPAAYEAPLKVFALAELPDCNLRLVGQVPPSLRDSFVRTLSLHSSKVSLCEDALSDAARVREISEAQLVFIAAPETQASMSTIMLTLSLDRPVLVEDCSFTRALADEVGTEWVRLHTGRLTAKTLESALDQFRASPPKGQPNLDARDPNVVAERYAAAFRAAAARR